MSASPDGPVTIGLLLRRLEETARWCAPRADPSRPASCLRTIDRCRDPFIDRRWLVHWVAEERARRLAELPGHETSAPQPLAAIGGRVLALFPDVNLYHELEWGECGGYIDKHNTPPTDTWLVYAPRVGGSDEHTGGALLAWVPPVFETPVQRAIDVNPEGSLEWFDRTGCPLANELRAAL